MQFAQMIACCGVRYARGGRNFSYVYFSVTDAPEDFDPEGIRE